jgi:hypothetical protein
MKSEWEECLIVAIEDIINLTWIIRKFLPRASCNNPSFFKAIYNARLFIFSSGLMKAKLASYNIRK